MMIRLLILLLLLASTMAACSVGTNTPQPAPKAATAMTTPAPTGARPPTATPAPTTTPPGCGPDEIAAFLGRFLDVQSRGDVAALRGFFPQEGSPTGSPDHLPNHFQWYSMTEGDPQRGGQHFVAYRLDDLWPYFAARRQQRERLQLVRLTSTWVGSDGVANIGYTLTREADDRPTTTVFGKGAINCKEQSIIVWSMGTGAVVSATPAGTVTRE